LTVSAPPVGAVESLVNVSVAAAVVPPAASAAVTTSVGELVVPCDQLNAFDSNGPPAGVDTVDALCDQPPVVPPSGAVADETGPDSLSLTAFVSLKEPPPVTEPR
jgi:hypothetical protein